jgi:hypothetical protein
VQRVTQAVLATPGLVRADGVETETADVLEDGLLRGGDLGVALDGLALGSSLLPALVESRREAVLTAPTLVLRDGPQPEGLDVGGQIGIGTSLGAAVAAAAAATLL